MNKEPKTDSLKNQSENFNENFTQEKEQIIIDETECKDYDNGCCKGSCCLNSVSIVNSCDSQNMRCDFYVNKLEKQLARKTQECESLKEEIEILKDNFDTATRDCNELIEELRQECEELKGKYKNVLDLAKQNADANEYCLQELEQENYRYRKALEEIEAATKINCEEICGRKFENCNDTSCFSVNILDIIQKVKQVKN